MIEIKKQHFKFNPYIPIYPFRNLQHSSNEEIRKEPRKMKDVFRCISYYEKNGDKFIGEIPLTKISLNDLLSVISQSNYKDDLKLCNPYLLDKAKLDKIAHIDQQTFDLNLDSYESYL